MKKLLPLILAAMMVIGLVPLAATAEAPVTIKWVSLGGGMPENYDTWKTKVDAYLMEKIGVNLDVEVLSWGAYGDRRNAIVNGGEEFDIIFTDGGSYAADIEKGALLDVTELLPTAAPELYKTIPEDMWEAIKINGKFYAVPTIKDSALAQFFILDPEVVEKTGIDASTIKDLAGLDPLFKKMKENGVDTPFMLNKGGMYQMLDVYDGMGMGNPLIGVRYDDEERKVVSVFEQEEIVNQLKQLNTWVKEGIINADASTLTEYPTYRPFYMGQGWKGAWNYEGRVFDSYMFLGPIFSSGTVMGSMNGISAGTKNPEKVLAFLELVNTDTKLRDMICYGEEGVNFEYKDGLVVQDDNNPWTWARYTQGNHLILTPITSDPEFINNLKDVNATAKASVVMGFNVDRSNMEDELAAMKAIYEKYVSEMMTGVRAPDEIIPQMLNELKAVGFDDVMAEAQRQVDEHFKK